MKRVFSKPMNNKCYDKNGKCPYLFSRYKKVKVNDKRYKFKEYFCFYLFKKLDYGKEYKECKYEKWGSGLK